ncbi:helix-turn-helix transcriptional regulator [Amycolatopsis sp. H20-H5]|uniref:helix-turn-helix transcriptional regulator n=1 Tax=Amycolatopsis sp. H20-H5 TaxID=3046309 RepID=UPI002DB9CB40|nr:metalloregulator ArsR/SmtB family transcription factor [Amycolatopsis sp. H20-H5]MEC3976644.1 metalloregulator ArsR/SmtB family transcription factor [Amycolatopsis sp. H20-H5]
MKKNGTSDPTGGGLPRVASSAVPVQVNAEGRTRHEVARLLLEQGPMAAVVVAEQLGISPTAVRRHLDALVADGEAETRDASRREPRGRGRPAKLFLLTESGRARFGHAYDDLAVSAIRFLAEHAGEDAVRAFAERRVAALVEPHRGAITAETEPVARAEALATALSREGYAASTRQVGAGEQLCQHHCPVAHVAAEFPQLCEAETEAFAKLLGTHVQRLATIARGDNACTTHVPAVSTGIPAAVEPESTVPSRAAQSRPSGRPARIPDGGKPA